MRPCSKAGCARAEPAGHPAAGWIILRAGLNWDSARTNGIAVKFALLLGNPGTPGLIDGVVQDNAIGG
jgi:hypothetical protein